MSVKRYDLDFAGSMIENDINPDKGDWVASEDHDAEVQRLNETIERLHRLNNELSADRLRHLKKIRELDACVPDPYDLIAVCDIAETWLDSINADPRASDRTAIADIRATLVYTPAT